MNLWMNSILIHFSIKKRCMFHTSIFYLVVYAKSCQIHSVSHHNRPPPVKFKYRWISFATTISPRNSQLSLPYARHTKPDHLPSNTHPHTCGGRGTIDAYREITAENSRAGASRREFPGRARQNAPALRASSLRAIVTLTGDRIEPGRLRGREGEDEL